ncbi:MAG: hypothetical protein AB1726_16960 [Planctomycetota bacterium]
MHRLLLAVLPAVAVALGPGPQRPIPPAGADPAAPVLVPFVVGAARALPVVGARLLVCNASAAAEPLLVEELTVAANGVVLDSLPIGASLASDPRYAALNALVERMPEEIAHLRRPRRFAAPDAPAFAEDEITARWAEIDARAAALRADYLDPRRRPFVEVPFPLPLDQVFAPEDAPGTDREIELAVRWRRGARAGTTVAVHSIALLPPLPPAPPTLPFSLGEVTLHAGDLHVHSCHGEAVNACAPSTDCAAESFQTSGSFTYAELKTQYQALGLDWFTATDHSYCINSDAEYQAIAGETAALTDGAFLVLPDIELSSEEEGPQSGSDLADLLCLLGPAQNHMGAHGISARKEGGDDGFLGFCNGLFSDALDGFLANAARIRAEGGYPIINHPSASSFAWNSTASTLGLEANQMHGVEIWNGAAVSGQGGDVASWVGALLGGRILYAYAGSDTHDAAFAFGANHAVFVNEPFDAGHLEAVLERGRAFVSNGPVLILEVELAGQSLLLGTIQAMSPSQPAAPLAVRAHYDFGASSSTITVFRGRAGDGAETVVATSPPLTGAGVFECADTLDPTAPTHYRAYSEAAGGGTVAYTNPVFFRPGSGAYVPYGEGLGGANVATLASVSNPTIGSVNRLDVAGYSPAATVAFFVFSSGAIPGGLPVLGGYLLVTLPYEYFRAEPLAGGAAYITEEIPFDPSLAGATVHWQSAALDPAQPQRVGFSNGLSMTVRGIVN